MARKPSARVRSHLIMFTAFLIVLGGSAYAALPKRSVGTQQLKNGAVTRAKIAAALKDGSANLPSLRTLGTGANQALPGNARPAPGGAAGGALSGTYPNPTLNVSGGDNGPTGCKNGEALTTISTLAALTCSTGVYSDGNSNVAAGPNTLGALTTGVGNTGLGKSALENVSSGGFNSALGQFTLSGTINGSHNTAIGREALDQNPSGHDNVALGDSAGLNNSSGSSNVYIANPSPSNTESNTIRIGTQGTGSGQQNKAFLAGVTGTTIGATTSPVLVDTSGQLGTTSSSRRFKRDIQPLGPASERLMSLRPVSFYYKRSVAGGPSSLHFGLIAEQLARVYPNLVVYGQDGRPSAVAYQELPALLLAQIQRQQTQISSQQAEINWLMRHLRGH